MSWPYLLFWGVQFFKFGEDMNVNFNDNFKLDLKLEMLEFTTLQF